MQIDNTGYDTKEFANYQILLYGVLEEFIKALRGTDEHIRNGFEHIGKYFGFDRIGLIMFSADSLIVNKTVYWNSKTWIYDESAEFHSLVEFPWLMRQFRSGQIVMLENIDDVPEGAFSEKEYFDGYGIRTFVARPLLNDENGKVAGFLHLDATIVKTDLDYAKLSMLSGLEESLMSILQEKEELAAIKASMAEKDILLNNTDIQMWYMLNPTIYGSANEAHAKFVGKTCEELMHSEIYTAFDIKEANLLIEITLEVFEKRMQITRELTIKNSQNRERVLLISWNPILADNNEVSYVICAANDITDLKKLQEVLVANQNLTAVNKEFAAINLELAAANDRHIEINTVLQKEIAERKLAEERLEKAYEEIKNAQSQIIQQEKMASIGQLAAGVAHEINNPMGFIISNLASLKKYTGKIAQFFQMQDETVSEMVKNCTDESGKAKAVILFQKLQETKRLQKIDYIMNDLESLIHETMDGADRVKTIVQDLKGFARITDEGSMLADINAGIESTINIIWNELKYKTTIVKEYGNIPLTKCNQGQLNQVFMNILMNAVQAIETQGEVRIKTWVKDGNTFVSIEDTGRGMPSDVINRIFEPFFTTKDVGKGTGLGLSVSYEIIKKHGGEIKVGSELGKGTTFTVKIPIVTE